MRSRGMAASCVFRLGSVLRGVGARPLKLMIKQIQLDKDTEEDGDMQVTEISILKVTSTTVVPYAPPAPHVPFSGFKALPDLVVFRVGFRSHFGKAFEVSRLSNYGFRLCMCLVYISQDSKNL